MVWPLGVYFLVVLALAALLLVASYLLGERHREQATGSPYESGIVAAGSARVRFSAQFYLVAAFFVIFDLEAVFIYAWAVGGLALGWTGYAELVVFVAVLLAALVYLARVGALDVGPAPRSTRSGRKP